MVDAIKAVANDIIIAKNNSNTLLLLLLLITIYAWLQKEEGTIKHYEVKNIGLVF